MSWTEQCTWRLKTYAYCNTAHHKCKCPKTLFHLCILTMTCNLLCVFFLPRNFKNRLFLVFVKLEAEERQLFFFSVGYIPSWDHSQLKITNLNWSWFWSSAAQVKPIIGQKKRIQTRLCVFSGCLLTWLPHGLDITRNDVGGRGWGSHAALHCITFPLWEC